MKIGIFGGTFNPVHIGHAIIASYVIQHCGLDQLWMMVSPLNPFKVEQGEVNNEHRLRMVEMVSRKIDRVMTSGFEFTLPRPSYTVDTLNALQQKFPDDEFSILIGADNWAAFDRWIKHEELIEKYHIIVYPRQGYAIEVPEKWTSHVRVIDAPIIEISSLAIRQEIKKGMDMSFSMPADVYEYVKRHKLYQE